MNTNNDKKKVLVPRDRSFSNLLFAQDVTEFAILDTTGTLPPTLPVSAHVPAIVAALEKSGYKIIAASMKKPDTIKVETFRSYLKKVQLTDEARYAMVMMKPEYQDKYESYKFGATPTEKSRVNHYVCNLDMVVRFHVGLWR